MQIQVAEGEAELRILLEPREVRLLRVSLERATYRDTDPAEQQAAIQFAEDLLRGLSGTATQDEPEA